MAVLEHVGLRPALDELRRISAEARRLIVQSIHHAGAGHLGGPPSATDLLTALYFDQMRIDPERPGLGRKGSSPQQGPFLYRPLHRAGPSGLLPIEELKIDAAHSPAGHSDMHALPGLEMSTGSRGQGLSPGAGMALGSACADWISTPSSCWVTAIQEGQIWSFRGGPLPRQPDRYRRLQRTASSAGPIPAVTPAPPASTIPQASFGPWPVRHRARWPRPRRHPCGAGRGSRTRASRPAWWRNTIKEGDPSWKATTARQATDRSAPG